MSDQAVLLPMWTPREWTNWCNGTISRDQFAVLLHKDKEHLALRNNFRVNKKFLIFKFDCITSSVSVAIGVLDSLLNSEPLKLLIFNSCSENLEDLCLVFRFFFFLIFDGWSMILFLSSNTSSSVCWPNKILYLSLLCNFQKENTFTLLIILIVKSHQIELHSKNLLLKVSKSRKQTMMSLILQKNKQNSLKILSWVCFFFFRKNPGLHNLL